ncbi:DNA/RNA nuclease SfsA, partial [Acetomicrobium sp. S15 = DSM 107314]
MRDGQKVLLEVKSCTLFGKEVAAFPDAVTARGKRHIEEMARLTKEGF